MNRAVEAFRAMGDQTRLRILRVLREAGEELCVCEVADALDKPQYTVSKSLTVLRQAGLVEERRDGRFMMYTLRRGPFNDRLFKSLEKIKELDPLDPGDSRRLAERLALREHGKCVITTHQK